MLRSKSRRDTREETRRKELGLKSKKEDKEKTQKPRLNTRLRWKSVRKRWKKNVLKERKKPKRPERNGKKRMLLVNKE